MAPKVLIVEDEDKINRMLQLELQHEGYDTAGAETGREGLEKAMAGGWDLILLDVMLPGLSGMEVLRRLRSSDKRTPVILLTARDSVPEKVMGLDLGANDYVTKPFEIEELLARIRVALRAGKGKAPAAEITVWQLDGLFVNARTREVTRAGQSIDLTPKEFELLAYLLGRDGEVVSREQIINDVWGYDFVGDTNIVDVYIRYLRKKIDYGFGNTLIHTIRGVGYQMRDAAASP
ncbi:MAG: response regulator transcription factor [Paenibacillaceae bacterium]|uniref:response regulator transcription factor n=1 Tax=Paenibacillus cymbidii TaxID=1639034 RepID=UPI0010814E4C|nr:response regulator transcription factor [Paenibacillus cymbidii]MBO9605876.1 response regulator transcription factor [Paenibacillaceae bacterium]